MFPVLCFLSSLFLLVVSAEMSEKSCELEGEGKKVYLRIPKNEKRPHEWFVLENGLKVLLGKDSLIYTITEFLQLHPYSSRS